MKQKKDNNNTTHNVKCIRRKQIFTAIITAVFCICFLTACPFPHKEKADVSETNISNKIDISDFNGNPYIEINGNQPDFSEEDMSTEAFERYSNLDKLGRCGTAFDNVCHETLPKEEREPIGEIRPSGWKVANYHELIEGNYLYNRCHLIAFSLAGENANEKNLITGTRYLNTEGMQPFELVVLDYVRTTGNHVLYRVTPIFEGDNLVASGVEMEALSLEDQGAGVCYHIYAYNVQPGVIIDYKTGDSRRDPDYDRQEQGEKRKEPLERTTEQETDPEDSTEGTAEVDNKVITYILNTNTRRFHLPSCESVDEMKEKNIIVSTENRDKIIEEGYQLLHLIKEKDLLRTASELQLRVGEKLYRNNCIYCFCNRCIDRGI